MPKTVGYGTPKSKVVRRVSVKSNLNNDRPIVAGSPRDKAQKAKRIKDRAARRAKAPKPTPKRRITTTTTTAKRHRGFPKLKSGAEKRQAELDKIP